MLCTFNEDTFLYQHGHGSRQKQQLIPRNVPNITLAYTDAYPYLHTCTLAESELDLPTLSLNFR